MGVQASAGRKYYRLWIENAPVGEQRVDTNILVGTTTQQQKDSYKLAEALYTKLHNGYAADVYNLPREREQIRFSKYAAWYREHKTPKHRGRTREAELLTVLERYFVNERDDVLLSRFTTMLVDEYQTWRAAAGVTNRTINREVDHLKIMLREACPTYLAASPLKGMARYDEAPVRRRIMSKVEERKLLAVAKRDPQDYLILVLGIDFLVRLGDLIDLQWDDVADGSLWVAWTKNGDPLEVPLAISRRAVAGLTALKKAKRAGPFLFPKFRKAEDPRDWPGSVRQRLEYLCREADVPYGRTKRGITFHWGTRRTGTTRRFLDDRWTPAEVQALGGWKTPDTPLAIYTEMSTQDMLKKRAERPRAHRTPNATRKRA
ncbi:MAG TPA: site-specific integrase [Steroidobacteraceae bacterium]|nr:site-specific integrase [Steroidobacteraceae bacterium]